LYNDRLIAHGSVRNHVLGDLLEESKHSTELDTSNPLLMIDTAGALMYEAVEEDQSVTESKYNFGEVDLVLQAIKELLDSGVKEPHIGVISPYSAQVNEIRKELKKKAVDLNLTGKIEISTVDGFQGREKEVIIISMVRSNPQRNIGFLANEKRMNVAVTRAKRLCILIGDSHTVSANSFLDSLCKHFKQFGHVRSAFDYQGNPNVRSMYGVKPRKESEETKQTQKSSKPELEQKRKEKQVKEADLQKPKSTVETLIMKPKIELTEKDLIEIAAFNEQRRVELSTQLNDFISD
jgi:hypothetical protein